MWIHRRENQRRGAIEAILFGAQNHRRNVTRLAGVAVEHRHLAAINQIRMQRIGRDIAVFFDADGGPVAKSDFAKVAAAGGADRAAFLLASVDPVGELVVGDDVIEKRGGLVVPGTPGLAAVHADGRALVHGEGDDVGVFGIDPDGVVVVAAGRALDGREILAGVSGAVSRSVGHVDHIFISWIDAHAAEVVAATPDSLFIIHLLPAFTSIIGAVNTAAFLGVQLFRVDPGIHAVGVAGGDGRTDATDTFGLAGQSLGELPPSVATVGGFVESAAGPVVATAGRPRRTARGPHAGEDHLRVAGIEDQIHAADVFVFVENLLPGLAAVERTEHAALGVRPVGMSLGRDEQAIGIFGIDDDGCDLLRVAQSEMLPGVARVGRFVDSVAYGKIGTTQAFSTANVDYVWAQGSNGERSDGTCRLIVFWLVIEDRIPGAAEVRRLPNPAVIRRHVEDIRLARDALNRDGAAAAKRADQSPVKLLVQRRVIRLGGKGERKK